ncbi:MAG: extracellular matrix regulator RemB [Bacillota bacterium]
MMLLHIGNEVVIPKKDLIAVLDYDVHVAGPTRNFLRAMRSEDRFTNLSEEGKERSIVLTTDRVFISSISCYTLKKRAESVLLDEG